MVNYECYRCGYTNNNKSNIIRHINRKNTCKVSFLDIKLDDCKKEILSGMSYKDYCGKCSVDEMDQNIPKYPHFGEKISPKYPQNIPKNEQKLTEISKCNYCQKNLSSYKNLRRHLKTCKEKQKDDTVRESMTELARLLNEKEKELNNKDKFYKKELESKENEMKKIDIQIEQLIEKAGLATTNNNTPIPHSRVQYPLDRLPNWVSRSSTLQSSRGDNPIPQFRFVLSFLVLFVLAQQACFYATGPLNYEIY